MGATSRISGELNFSIFTIHVTFWSQRSVTEQFIEDQFYYMMVVNLQAFFLFEIKSYLCYLMFTRSYRLNRDYNFSGSHLTVNV